jgi:hypothetical protein
MNTSDLSGLAWRKSTRSGTTSNCVEVAWRKSSYSSTQSNCVEVAFGHAVLVRDSKNTAGPRLTFPRSAWSTFLAG